ncbi:MAG: YdcF family protein [Emticicia sp.]|nr:YdcF family protein [Emticicia sp.]
MLFIQKIVPNRKNWSLQPLFFCIFSQIHYLSTNYCFGGKFHQHQFLTVKTHDVGIILTGGIINENKLPQENIFLGKSADRIAQTIQLYKNGKISKILISGGEISILGKTPKKEVEEIAKYLIISGVPKENIFMETHAQNTRENAENCSKILKKHFKNQSYLLITSGFHLRRAKACFEKFGIKTDTFGANYLSHERNYYWYNILPKEEYFEISHLLFREIIGYWTYKAMGWI